MNKKSLFASIAVFIGVIFFVGFANAQVCTPDPQYTQPGIYPDSATNLDTAIVGVPYADTLTAVVPTDTVDGSGTCCDPVVIDSMVLTSIVGLPPGLSYQCEPPSCGFPGGTNGCVLISGTPTDTGTFNITANITAYIVCCPTIFLCGGCTQVTQTQVIDYYQIIVLPGCSPFAPGFTFTPSNLLVNFTDTSITTGTTTWSWNFGDGNTSTVQNPANTYANAGTYNVCLIVTDSCGTDTICQTVAVCTPPVAGFNFTTSGLTANFVDASTATGATSWLWDFGDGSPPDITPNPSHTYSVDSTYYVCLSIADSCGANMFCDSVQVTSGGCSAPVADFAFTDTNLTAYFTDASAGANISWAWDFGDGTGTSTAQDTTYTYSTDSTYYVCLTVTDSCGNATFCDSVTVTCPVPVAGFSVIPTDLTASFTDMSVGALAWAWDFGDSTSSTQQDPTHNYGGADTYLVCLTVMNSCGNINTFCDSVTVTSPVCPAPAAGFTFIDTNLTVNFTNVSTGADLNWSWDFGDGSSVDTITQNPAHLYTADNTYNVCLTVTDSCGSDSTCMSVTVMDTTTGISPRYPGLALGSVKVYPNPANDLLIVEINDLNNGSYDVELYDHMGRLVRNYQDQSSGKLKINRKDLNTGLYFLRVKTAQGIYSNKIVFE